MEGAWKRVQSRHGAVPLPLALAVLVTDAEAAHLVLSCHRTPVLPSIKLAGTAQPAPLHSVLLLVRQEDLTCDSSVAPTRTPHPALCTFLEPHPATRHLAPPQTPALPIPTPAPSCRSSCA